MPNGTVIHSESDIVAGPLKVNSAYDLNLIKRKSGDYEILVFMKLQFFFVDNGKHIWNGAQKSLFMKDWEKAIKNAWGGRVIKTLSGGKKVFLEFDFKIQEAGWMMDHWEITVKKIKAGTFATSYVVPAMGNVMLDSEDLKPVSKGATAPQRGAVHEFGHMLGLLDEYKSTSPHKSDTLSVMHSAELIRPRHNSTIATWLNNTLILKNIK